MLGRLLLVKIFVIVCILASGQSILNFGSFHKKKLSAGFQSNRIALIQFDTAKFNIQFQSSIINEKLRFQQFNFAARYNLRLSNTRLVFGSTVQNNFYFKHPEASIFFETEYTMGAFRVAGLVGYNFFEKDSYARLGANARFLSIYYIQASYGRSDFELFGGETTAEASLICQTRTLSLKFASQIPIESSKFKIQYNRFITTFLVTILK